MAPMNYSYLGVSLEMYQLTTPKKKGFFFATVTKLR